MTTDPDRPIGVGGAVPRKTPTSVEGVSKAALRKRRYRQRRRARRVVLLVEVFLDDVVDFFDLPEEVDREHLARLVGELVHDEVTS